MPHILVFSPSFPSFVFMAVALFSKKRSLNDTDPRAVFSAGWCGSPSARVPGIVGRSSTSATRVGIAPTSCTPGAGHTSEALVQCLWWFHLHCERSHKQRGDIFSPSKPFAFLKGCNELPGREECGAQRTCVQTHLFLLWVLKLQLTARASFCCSELLTALLFEFCFKCRPVGTSRLLLR